MKRLLLAIGICALAASVVFADQHITPQGNTIRFYNVDTIIVEGTATDQITFVDSNQVKASGFWVGATITIHQNNSSLTDSTRVITAWDLSTFTFTFAAFGADSLENNDSLTIRWPAGDGRIPYSSSTTLNNGSIDTSETYRITPGARISSQHIMTASGAALDSVGTDIILQVCVEPTTINGADGWARVDSILFQTVDTVHYNSWGVIDANYIRFIMDARASLFRDGGVDSNATHYGRVLSDK